MNNVMGLSLAVLVGLALAFLLLSVVAVLMENSDRTINRLPFFGWVLAYTFGPMIASALGGIIAAAVAGLVLVVPVYQRYVQRARAAGMGKTIAFLSVVPLVSLITTLILLFAPSSHANGYGEEAPVWQG